MTVSKTFPTDIPSKADPVDADILLVADSEDNNELKQITIGSITADIADGIINDSTVSLTTTFSSTEIESLNDAQDTALTTAVGTINTALGTKLNKAGQLRTGNGAWKTIYNDGSGNEVELALGASGTVLNSNGATSAPTWVAPSTDVNGQTEDTTGDMSADFLLAYDTSATANRKQKPQVYSATDAEAEAGTSTTKWVLPTQIDRYSLNTNTKQTFQTIQIPIVGMVDSTKPTGWSGTSQTNSLSTAGGYAKVTTSAAWNGLMYTGGLPGSGTQAFYRYAETKDVRLVMPVKFKGGATIEAIGLHTTTTGTNFGAAETDTTDGNIRFCKNASDALYACVSNGSAYTATQITGITFTSWNVYEIVTNPGTDVKFYVNGVLKATITTNIPTTSATVNIGISNASSVLTEFKSPIISIEN